MTTLTKLESLFSDNRNYEQFRAYTEHLKLPCIPFLGAFSCTNFDANFNFFSGIYLTDLLHIDTAYPRTDLTTRSQRDNLINNILRVLAHYQTSTYGTTSSCFPIPYACFITDHLTHIPCVQSYLRERVVYIQELQKFIEDEMYR